MVPSWFDEEKLLGPRTQGGADRRQPLWGLLRTDPTEDEGPGNFYRREQESTFETCSKGLLANPVGSTVVPWVLVTSIGILELSARWILWRGSKKQSSRDAIFRRWIDLNTVTMEWMLSRKK